MRKQQTKRSARVAELNDNESESSRACVDRSIDAMLPNEMLLDILCLVLANHDASTSAPLALASMARVSRRWHALCAHEPRMQRAFHCCIQRALSALSVDHVAIGSRLVNWLLGMSAAFALPLSDERMRQLEQCSLHCSVHLLDTTPLWAIAERSSDECARVLACFANNALHALVIRLVHSYRRASGSRAIRAVFDALRRVCRALYDKDSFSHVYMQAMHLGSRAMCGIAGGRTAERLAALGVTKPLVPDAFRVARFVTHDRVMAYELGMPLAGVCGKNT
jgi:hypothetical protein